MPLVMPPAREEEQTAGVPVSKLSVAYGKGLVLVIWPSNLPSYRPRRDVTRSRLVCSRADDLPWPHSNKNVFW